MKFTKTLKNTSTNNKKYNTSKNLRAEKLFFFFLNNKIVPKIIQYSRQNLGYNFVVENIQRI